MGVCLTTLNYSAVKDLIKNNLLINNKNTMSILPNHKDINLEKGGKLFFFLNINSFIKNFSGLFFIISFNVSSVGRIV